MRVTSTSSVLALERLIVLRWLALTILTVIVAIAVRGVGVALPSDKLAPILAAQAGMNLLSQWRLRSREPVGAMELSGHLVADTTVLGMLLYFTGGWYNPFISLLLVPVVLAAASLPFAACVASTVYAVFLYSMLARYYLPLPLSGERAMHLHILGMWITFVLSAVLVVGFMLRLRSELAQSDMALAQARDAKARDERILALGIQAASTVHELATPLNTLAVGLENLRMLSSGEQKAELCRMEQQAERCRTVLQRLRDTDRQTPQIVPLGAWLDGVLRDWQVVRPGRLELAIDGALAARMLRLDDVLRQALFNLLDNAARVSPVPPHLAARLEDGRLVLEIFDRGPGYDEQALAVPAGIGLLLTRAAVERVGGVLELGRQLSGGTRAAILLPLHKMDPGHV